MLIFRQLWYFPVSMHFVYSCFIICFVITCNISWLFRVCVCLCAFGKRLDLLLTRHNLFIQDSIAMGVDVWH